MNYRYTICAVAASLALSFPALAQSMEASATMVSANGDQLGTVTLSENGNGVLIRADLSGLPSGLHGFHIHETGSCEEAFEAAGGHYAPEGHEHGPLNPAGPHAGDLPNLWAAESGDAVHHVLTDKVTLASDQPNTLFDADGSAVVIHKNPDSYESDAGAGGRIACGVIEPAS